MIIESLDKKISLCLDSFGTVISLKADGTELCEGSVPLFRIGLRDENGAQTIIDSASASNITEHGNSIEYKGFAGIPEAFVTVSVMSSKESLLWKLRMARIDSFTIEYVDFPLVSLKPLKPSQTSLLFPYNEGAIIDDISVREKSWFVSEEPAYPSKGSFCVFPNMLCSQFMAYMRSDEDKNYGIYFGAHDKERGVKYIDFYRNPASDAVILTLRNYTGLNDGMAWENDFDIIWKFYEGTWEDAASIYRDWFTDNLPSGVTKTEFNKNLPDWYKDSPVVITYPVRGIHDTDIMEPNAFYPYTNALPFVEEIASKTNSRLLVLLMHWEGTAPWAPPYVFPPYGGTDNFFNFRDKLHEKGNLFGVYCSGFGYTLESNLVDNYKNEAENNISAFCAGPDGNVSISRICTAQRKGYDICPCSPDGQKILNEAYKPLFENGLDYVQILDQNHGGGQYFCYSKKHGHPYAPGKWMTSNMQKLLGNWNEMCGKELLGCESAASEPFIGNLLFSDNRYELNWQIGRPVPLYAYIYHEYIRNFMGNQCCSPFPQEENTLPYRIAYSFAAGDAMTLVITPDGQIADSWGVKKYTYHPDKELILKFIGNLVAFYKSEAGKYLYSGRMVKAFPVISPVIDKICFGRNIHIPSVVTTAWDVVSGGKAQIIINHTDKAINCSVITNNGPLDISVGPLNAKLIRFDN